MNLIKSLSLLCIFAIVLNSCSSFSEAGKVLRNEKTSTTDEFLIKKNDPLTQPPDFETIPEPRSIKNKAEKEQNSIEKILKKSQTQSGNSSGPLDPLNVPKDIQSKSLFFTRPTMKDHYANRIEVLEGAEKLFEQIKFGKVKVKIFKEYNLVDAKQAHLDLESRKINGPAIFVV